MATLSRALRRSAARRAALPEDPLGVVARPAYLDNQATTPLDPRVLDAMLPWLTGHFGNPHSRSHGYGWEAEEAVEAARAQVAQLINADPKEVFFTSGATESNNISVKGAAKFYKDQGKTHLVTLTTEHKCVLASCRTLAQEGFDVTYLGVKQDGLVDLEELRNAIRPETALVSAMWVNNEIGVIQPIKDIGRLCKEKGVVFHTDAAQALGKIPVDVKDVNAALMSMSGHKIYGPKGVGALYVRRKPRVRVRPQMDGGGQERGLRSGTLSPALCVGLGRAAEIAREEMDRDAAHIERLSARLRAGVVDALPAITINGSATQRYAGNLNASFAGIEGESMLMALAHQLSVSSGSACTSASLEPSYVLRAIGVDEGLAHTSLRFGIGRFTTEEEVDQSIEAIKTAVHRLRSMSPVWDEETNDVVKDEVQWS